MLAKTLGIVLGAVPYDDHTQFLHVYTERFGKVTYRSPLRPSRRGGGGRTLSAPLTVLDLVVDHRAASDIQRIREARLVASPYVLTAGDPAKAAQCLFIAELLDKVIREEEANQALFDFIQQGIELLSIASGGSANFHIVFCIRLFHLLGFHIDADRYVPGCRFDISEGVFTTVAIYHPYYLTAESAACFHTVLACGFSDLPHIAMNKTQREQLLDMLLLYLKIHLPEVGEIRSVEVLKDLFA